MHAAQEYSYMQSDGFQVLELPYAGGRLAMDVLLPTTSGGTAGLNVSQLPGDLTTWLSGLSPQQVDVSLPKFTLSTQFDLGDQLQSLGITDAFNKDLADFTGVTDAERLYISQVVHKAYIAVDETGTEAAAATGVGIAHATCVVAQPPISNSRSECGRFDFGAVSENVNDLLHDNWENRKSEWHYSVSRSEVR